jgi:hypothetical protein
MPFMFNSLLEEAGISPKDVRLLRHQTALPDGRTPLDLLRGSREAFDTYQGTQTHTARAYFLAPFWAAFVGLPDGRTMFAGLYEVGEPALIEHETWSSLANQMIPAGTEDAYPLALSDMLTGYIERLFIEWGGGLTGKRAWRQRADQQNKIVTELLPSVAPAPFPGFMRVVAPLSHIAISPPSWIDALSSARGIYLLACPRTGEAYIGSATGEGGFWQRWQEYCANGHGGNVALKARERSDYTVSVLQVAGSADTRDDILAMESSWKAKLETRRTGLTRN